MAFSRLRRSPHRHRSWAEKMWAGGLFDVVCCILSNQWASAFQREVNQRGVSSDLPSKPQKITDLQVLLFFASDWSHWSRSRSVSVSTRGALMFPGVSRPAGPLAAGHRGLATLDELRRWFEALGFSVWFRFGFKQSTQKTLKKKGKKQYNVYQYCYYMDRSFWI